MSAYVIFIRKALKNQDELKTYHKLARKASEGHAIKPLAFYGETVGLENMGSETVAIFKFPDMEQAKAWYHSEDYQNAKKHRDLAGDFSVILTEGLAD